MSIRKIKETKNTFFSLECCENVLLSFFFSRCERTIDSSKCSINIKLTGYLQCNEEKKTLKYFPLLC